jgi:hypothetical protein
MDFLNNCFLVVILITKLKLCNGWHPPSKVLYRLSKKKLEELKNLINDSIKKTILTQISHLI